MARVLIRSSAVSVLACALLWCMAGAASAGGPGPPVPMPVIYPDSDVTKEWNSSTGTTHWQLVNDEYNDGIGDTEHIYTSAEATEKLSTGPNNYDRDVFGIDDHSGNVHDSVWTVVQVRGKRQYGDSNHTAWIFVNVRKGSSNWLSTYGKYKEIANTYWTTHTVEAWSTPTGWSAAACTARTSFRRKRSIA